MAPRFIVMGVSIPERVWGGLEPLLVAALRWGGIVSIPERVWGGLEPIGHTPSGSQGKFQSLRGFGVGWSMIPKMEQVCKDLFQSLRGFGVGWSV